MLCIHTTSAGLGTDPPTRFQIIPRALCGLYYHVQCVFCWNITYIIHILYPKHLSISLSLDTSLALGLDGFLLVTITCKQDHNNARQYPDSPTSYGQLENFACWDIKY